MLSSTNDGEVVAAARAILRTLEARGTDIHELAERVEGRKLSQAEMQRIYDKAFADGKKRGGHGGFSDVSTRRPVLPRDGVRDQAQGGRPANSEGTRLRRRHGPLVRPPRAVGEAGEVAARNLLQDRTTPMIEKPQKPKSQNGDLANLPPALAPLCRQPHWVLWRWERRREKWTKPPYMPTGANAKSDDPSTWSDYVTDARCNAVAPTAVSTASASCCEEPTWPPSTSITASTSPGGRAPGRKRGLRQ